MVRLARSAGRSRSDVYTAALREYVARHGPEEVTEVLDLVVGTLDEGTDPFVLEVGHQILRRTEW